MNPIQLTQHLQQALVNYLTTTFDVNRDGSQPELAANIRHALEAPGALFNGPFLELTPPYVKGCTLRQLVDEGVLSAKLLKLDCFQRGKPLPIDAPLYTHQEAAIRRIAGDGLSVVVSSGTGSGKTEAFLIPILNDLLIDLTPGVRAVLIYPLNALVNDQLDRLRELLRGTKITFGRYTSELLNTEREAREQLRGIDVPENEVICREQIRKAGQIPQILITNYAMLEYLLLRPEDSILFRSGTWRFIVLDEAHTYSGAKGIEASMLLRRLKLRLNKQRSDVRCIATSATLINDDPQDAVHFAQQLFDEDFTEAGIIFGQPDNAALLNGTSSAFFAPPPDRYLNVRIRDILEELALEAPPPIESVASRLWQAGVIGDEDYKRAAEHTSVGAFLHTALKRNKHLNDLLRWMLTERAGDPVYLQEAADRLFPGELTNSPDRLRALYHLIELGAQARPTEDQLPLLPARYHVFARPPQGVWVCINPNCPGRKSNPSAQWSRLYTSPRTACEFCNCAVYPLTVCRTCGQVYLRAEYYESGNGQYLSEKRLYDTKGRYLTWSPIHLDTSQIGDNDDLESEAAPETQAGVEAGALSQRKITLCLNHDCRRTGRCTCASPKRVKLYEVVKKMEKQKNTRGGIRTISISELERCCRCGDRPRVADSEIVTPLTTSGNPTASVLVTELYRRLPESPDPVTRKKPGGGRKLLTFYDSRQGAARFAAYLQDVFNQDLYRYMVPLGIRGLLEQNQRAPDFDELSEVCVQIGWNDLRVFQNDLELLSELKVESSDHDQRKLSRAERQRLKQKVQERLLAEITTNRRSRQSLEALGLVAVAYFEEPIDVSDLSRDIGLNDDQTRLLVRYLLDTLRDSKAIQLPVGVERDAKVFGRNVGNPTVVRRNAGAGSVPWIGQTTHHGRYRLTERMLAHCGQPADETNVQRVLSTIWEWLVDQCTLVGNASDGYRLSPARLFFNVPEQGWYRCERCQRLRYDAGALPCPHLTCGSSMRPVDLNEWNRDNYYYQVLKQPLIPLRIEEHTAQLDSDKGRDYQNAFKRGDINILSCSTTFEMGIDLGDLQAVFLNNVPPTVANYRQRSGRAGRRTGGTAYIVTWADNRPYDQQYFDKPTDIIRGQVRVPAIQLLNEKIRQRHVNAVLLSEFLRFCRDKGFNSDTTTVGAFFDPCLTVPRHIDQLDDWIQRHRAGLTVLVERFLTAVQVSPANSQQAIDEFVTVMDAERERYEAVTQYYRSAEEEMRDQRQYNEAENYKKLLERIQEDQLINYLSNRGVLPSYAFPLETVELVLPFGERQGAHLRLQRDLNYAISEYAPGAEVVADKRLWKSGGLIFYRDTPQQREYRLCSRCNHVVVAQEAGMRIAETQCPTCGESYKHRTNGSVFVTPDGFRTTKDSGKPAGQHVQRLQNVVRRALLLLEAPLIEERISSMMYCGYSKKGRLFYVNEGESGNGFRICMRCGMQVGQKDQLCNNDYRGQKCGSADLRRIMLGHTVQTDTLHLRLRSALYTSVPPQDGVFWNTVLYALLNGACRALQIERQDIGGLLYPIKASDRNWEYTVALYDAVPGGAGHVINIKNNLTAVVREAYNIVDHCDCETSCTRCLRDYSNQHIYDQLNRYSAITFLEMLTADLENARTKLGGAVRVVASDPMRWLAQHVLEARDQVWLAADTIGDAPLPSHYRLWIDVLHDLQRKGVEVTLALTQPPIPASHQPEALSLARHLQTLIENQLMLVNIPQLPGWQVVIDPDRERQRAVRLASEGPLYLSDTQHDLKLITTSSRDLVLEAFSAMQAAIKRGQPISLCS